MVGVGSAHGMGRSAKTVIAASVCLDSGCMRLSQSCFVNRKSITIFDLEMKDIIKVRIFLESLLIQPDLFAKTRMQSDIY